MTLEVEGDADRFACEFLCEKFRNSLDKRAAQGKNIRSEWNSGCDRPKLCQACGKLISLNCNAVKELSELPGMTTWSYTAFVDHRRDRMRYKLSMAEDDRRYRWNSVKYAEQVIGPAGTNGAHTIVHRCKKCGLSWCFFDDEKGTFEISRSPH